MIRFLSPPRELRLCAESLRASFVRPWQELIVEYEVDEIVLGYPKNMNDTVGERGEKTLAFKEMLERRTGLDVQLWDERLTTVAADKAMMEAGIRREERKEHVDRIAAVFILQGYLDYLKNREGYGLQ